MEYDIQLKGFLRVRWNDEKMVTELDKFQRKYGISRQWPLCNEPPGTVHTDWFKVYEESDNDPWTRGIVLYNKYMESATRSRKSDLPGGRSPNEVRNIKARSRRVNTIVVIGYSFPYFNREIDDLILKQIGEIDKIYLQYPEGEHLAIEQRLEKLAPLHSGFVRVDARDLFYIPDNF